MIFQIPVQKRPVILGFLLYTPLVLLLCLFCLNTALSQFRLRSVNDLYRSLFSGSPLSPDERTLMNSLNPHDLDVIMIPWSEPRRKAAFLIMDYNGYRGPAPDSVSVLMQSAPTPDPSIFDPVNTLMDSELYDDAEMLLRDMVTGEDPLPESVPEDQFFLLLRTVVMKTGTFGFWIDILGAEAAESGFGRSFFLGTCYEKQSQWDKALQWYQRAEEVSRNWEDHRRSQWYTLRLMIRQFPELLPVFFDSAGILRNDGAYFDDVLDELFSILIRQRRWSELASLLPHIKEAGLSEAASQGLFLLEKGREEGYVSFSEPLDGDFGFTPDPMGYYALRSCPETWPQVMTHDLSKAQTGSDSMDDVYQILIKAGYEEETYRLWGKNRETLSLETVKLLCCYLERKGDLYELIRFAGFWYYTYPAEQALELLPWVYPGAERYTISDESVPQELVLGIIRRESAFHESIFSIAGASGLMQLMPSTAEDLARRNRLESWNLLKADDNILLGTLYLKWLRERPWTSSYVDVLAAYNGGGGNLRSWKRRMGYHDPDLFIQSIPFKETRDYVRKVIVAAASYRYLDTGSPPGDWVEQFYRSF